MDILEELQNSRVKDTPLSRGEVRWGCRRGMLELDILLGDFFDANYDSLSEVDKTDFIKLIAYPDQDLFEVFLGNKPIPEPALNRVIEKIRHAASA